MFVCPTCDKEFKTEDAIRSHFLICWKEQRPYHKSSDAPHSADVVTREVNDSVMAFFERINNGRS